MDYAKAAQNAGYQNQVGASNAINAPKELGALQRVDGLRSGLQTLRNRLEMFFNRLDGDPGNDAAKGIAPVSSSLNGTLSDAEGELRTCLTLLESLHNRF